MDFAAKGQLIEWDEENSHFFYVHDPENLSYLPEDKLRHIFRDCILGLYYRNLLKNFH